MINSAYRKFTSTILILCLVYGQGFGQVANEIMNYNRQQYVAVQDNTRVVKPLISAKMQSDLKFSADLKFAADRILKLNATGLKTKQQRDDFNKTANAFIASFYNVAAGKARTSQELHSTIYSAVLPIIWFNAELTNRDFYYKISTLYRTQYNNCVGKLDKCDSDKTGNAMLFLNSYNPELVKLSKISSAMTDENTGEEAKVNFMQYAAPVLADRGGKVYFEEIINKLAKQSNPITKVTSGYVDPFALVKAFDNSYQWIKETCTHKDGFGGGVCAAFKGGKKPFRQYRTPKAPAVVNEMYKQQSSGKKDIKTIYLYAAAEVKQPAQLSSAIRMYGEFYSARDDWKDAFKFLLTAPLPSAAMVTCHRDIALANLALKSDLPATEKAALRLYMADRINNDYFALNKDSEIDQELRAALKNELGKTYVALMGYKGASPVKVISDEGFYSDIAFQNNEQEIEGFWKSMFNFKDRPAEAVTNVFILGAITKGAAKNSDKIWAGVINLFKGSKKLIVNMPAMVKRAQVQYSALKYLAGKNSMSTANYVYKNAVYRSAAKTAAKGGLNTVEGVASKEFFASSHYTASSHGNIGRISKDINKAVSVGLTDLSKGGAIPSYISAQEYKNGFNVYSKDLLTQQEKLLQTKVASKYKAKKLPAKVSASQKSAQTAAQSAADAPYTLPRKYMYSADKSRGLQLAQNEAFAQEYTFKNTVYRGLKQRGFDFVHTGTGLSLGENLTFHNMGFLQASGKVGLTYSANGASGFEGAAQSLLGSAAQNVLAPVETLKALGQNTVGIKQVVNMLNLGNRAIAFNNAMLMPQKAFENYYKISLMSLNSKMIFPPRKGSILNDFLTPSQQEKASFKISRSEGDIGSGFLLNYRGMPVVITAGHVVRENKFVYIQDSNGQKTTGVVLKSVFSPAMDLAAIFVKPSFLQGRMPFQLSLKEPEVMQPVMALGFPSGKEYARSVLTVFENNYNLPASKAPLYRTTADNLTYGSSGGPLLVGDLNTRVAGVAYALTYNQENALFIGLKTLRSFMTSLAREMILDPVNRVQWLPSYPDFVKNYNNLISAHISSGGLILPKKARFNTPPDLSVGVNLLSAQANADIVDKVEQATFKITRRSDKSGGSGFYIKYRGLPMIVTAAHVVRDDEMVEILDKEGILSFGKVFARSMITRGYDFALVLPERGFLEEKIPLELSFKEPSVNETLLAAGYPKDKWLRNMEITLEDAKFVFGKDSKPVYKLYPETGHGTSGGPLVQFGNNGKVVGVAHMGGDGNSFFASLPQLRKFISATLKSKFMDPKFSQAEFLKQYPELAKNYKNLLSAYKDKAGQGPSSSLASSPSIWDTDRVGFTEAANPLKLSEENKLIFEDASFMVTANKGESFGSGFYVKHRGVPMVITASHVVGAERTVTLTDKEGVTSVAKVLATSGTGKGYDIALLQAEPSFLYAKKPLTLSPKAQSAGASLLGLGFNMFGDVISKPFTLVSPSFKLEGSVNTVYKASPALEHGFSGGPLVEGQYAGRVSGLAHMTNAHNSFFIPSSTIRGFIKQAFIADLANPVEGGLAQTYPAFAKTYANVLESGVLKQKEPLFSIGEGTKRFGFKVMTGLFGMSPKQALNKLYSWGAKPTEWKGYPSLSSQTYKIDDINAYAADLSKPLPEYPFESAKKYVYRGMALDIPAVQNINANGIRLQDVGTHNNDYLALRYPSAGLAKYAKEMDCNKTICLTGSPKDAAHYALKHTSAEKQIPVVVHIKDIQVGGDAALGSSILMTALSDIPADKISSYSGLMQVNGANTWGRLGFEADGSLNFTPYVKNTPNHPQQIRTVRKPAPTAPSAAPKTKQLTTLPEVYDNFKGVFKKPLFPPSFADKFKLPGIRNLLNGKGLFGERFASFDMEAYRHYYNGVKASVIEIENPLFGKNGSGFYLKKGNMEALITAGHLVDGASTVRVRPASANGLGPWYTAKVAGYSLGEATDIGLIEINNPQFWHQMKPLPVSSVYPKEGENIYSYGFPWGITFEERVGVFKGFEPVGYKRLIRASEHTAPGSSGGPILYQGQVIGLCKKGICSEAIAGNPPSMTSPEPISWHTTWEELENFLYKAVLKSYPADLGWRSNPSFKYSSFIPAIKNLPASDRLLLDPRGYGFKDVFVIDPKPFSDNLYSMDFSLSNTLKKAGVNALGITVKMPAREALLKMYGYGFKPSFKPMPKAYGTGYEIEDISLYKPDMTKNLPPYPFGENKRYIFRGMSLDTKSVVNIHENGLRLQDVGESNSLYLHAIAPGALRCGMGDFRTICFTETPSEAAFYSMRYPTEEKPVPTVVNIKGIKEPNTRGFGILITRDVPKNHISSLNVLLNIGGENVWGRLVREDGKLIFYPYKK